MKPPKIRRHSNTYGRRGSRSYCDALSICNMVERFDKIDVEAYCREADAGVYSQGGWYSGEGRVAKAGVFARATAGRAEGAAAGAEASFCKAGVTAGPVVAEVNLNLNTSISVGTTHASLNILGFGASIGSTTYIATPLGKIGFAL
ncbi:hypothetical protein OTU49_005229 [Cherax quadricarinatus]|uniref:Uncharacterized protein n=1 Tax=Cherax quadricarinatus TaxID=27406 RepID=A0AAW0X9Z1_CHEQU